MALDLLDDLGRRAAARERELRIAGAPFPVPGGWSVRPQGPGDLGARLARVAEDARREGAASLVVLGADAPLLPDGLLGAAFEALEADDLALAPAEDGGYILIGFACGRLEQDRIRRLLSGIPWGTDRALEETLKAARGLRRTLLPGFWDVDRPEDLARLRRLAVRNPERLARVAQAMSWSTTA